MIFGVLVVAMFAIYCHVLVRRYKRPLGELLTWQAIKHNESIFVLMMVAACVAEGLSAATVLAPGLIPANPFARTTAHLFVSFAGIIGAMTLFKDTAQILIPGADNTSRFFQFLVVIFLGTLTFGSPILNLILMAGNLKQELELQLFLFGMNPLVTSQEWESTLAFYGYDPKWSAWAALEPNLKVSIGITFLHFVIAGLEGARSMSTKKRREELFTKYEEVKDKKEDKTEPEKDDKDKSDMNSMKKNLDSLLGFYGYQGSEKESLAKAGYEQLHAITDVALQGKMGVRVAVLAKKVEALSKKSLTDAERIQESKEIKEEIRKLFGGSRKETDPKLRGLGITLRAVK